jgi:hypothetical protein
MASSRRNRLQKKIDKDSAITAIIKGMDFLIALASRNQLFPAVRILHTSKEDLVYWAVDFNFQESEQDKFICNNLYNGLQLADFIIQYSAIEDPKARQQFLKGLEALRMDYKAITQVPSDS